MNHLEHFRNVRTFLFDVDGVLTNNQVLVMEDGKLLRHMSIRDGYALKRAVQTGFRVAVITGGKSQGVRERLRNLGVTDVYMGYQEKMEAFQDYIDLYDIDPEEILYMGDDIPDYLPMRKVGLPACPADAVPEVMAIAKYISPYKGGQGCARDVIEKVLRLHGKWQEE